MKKQTAKKSTDTVGDRVVKKLTELTRDDRLTWTVMALSTSLSTFKTEDQDHDHEFWVRTGVGTTTMEMREAEEGGEDDCVGCFKVNAAQKLIDVLLDKIAQQQARDHESVMRAFLREGEYD